MVFSSTVLPLEIVSNVTSILGKHLKKFVNGPKLLILLFHGLRTPNEGINQRYLKNWADVTEKICFGRTKEFGSGSEFSAVQ